MDERIVPVVPAEARPQRAETVDPPDAPPVALSDPRALTILTTEHWSLLTATSLVYNETFARGGMFLAFLAATLLVLGLISTATGFSDAFLTVAALILALDLFIGIATLGRINGASDEDLRYLQGMNRLRHAYHEMVPGLERYFITSQFDDFDSVAAFYGPQSPSAVAGLLHGFTTMPAVISVICTTVGAVLVAVLVMLATHDATAAGIAGLAAFVAMLVIFTFIGYRAVIAYQSSMATKWPAPPRDEGGPAPGA